MSNGRQPYKTNCAMMALARTEKVTTKVMHRSIIDKNQISDAKLLENDNQLEAVLSKRGYKAEVSKMSWADARNRLAELHRQDKSGKPTRYFAMTYPVVGGKVSDQGHAVSLNVTGKGRGVTVFGNNADKNASAIGEKPNWVHTGTKTHKGVTAYHRDFQQKLESGVKRTKAGYESTGKEQYQVTLYRKY